MASLPMEIDFLHHYGFSDECLNILRRDFGPNLLPLQEQVIRRHGLFEQKSLILSAPTSSGKTFLAELLFLFHAMRARNVVLLVPTKALANQRYQELRKRYAPLGYEIVLSTRDHPYHDQRILQSRFNLAVVIYEKMRSLMASDDAFVASLGACVVDEIHYVFNPSRGPDLELLLTRLREETFIQILGLSAILFNESIARWLRAEWVEERKRPVELRQGVLCQGRFRYREFNSQEEGIEPFPLIESSDEGAAMLEAAILFAERGESTLLFWPRRDHCYHAAKKLRERLHRRCDIDLTPLENLERSALRDFLLDVLPHGIAIHTSDLTADERGIVESFAKSGQVTVICATSTLAEGINFPVVNVLTTQRTYATRIGESESLPTTAPALIQRDQLLNMTGRAGRLGYLKENETGRGIIVTCTRGDIEGLLSLFQEGESPTEPLLGRLPFSQVMLKVVGSRKGITKGQCIHFLEKTLTGVEGGFSVPPADRIDDAVDSLLRADMITQAGDFLFTTPLGEMVCRSGLSERTASQLNAIVQTQLLSQPHPLDLLLLIAQLDEMQEAYLFVPRHQIQGHFWSRRLIQRIEEEKIELCPLSQDWLANPVRIRPEHHRAFKRTLLLYDWIQGVDLLALEAHYGVYTGNITRICEEAAWLMGCLADTAAARMMEPVLVHRLCQLQDRIILGLPEQGFEWVSHLRKRQLSRRDVLNLIESGFTNPGMVQEEDRETLERVLSPAALNTLFPQEQVVSAEESFIEFLMEETIEDASIQVIGAALATAAVQANLYRMRFDSVRPNLLHVQDRPVSLTRLETDFLRCLMRHPEACVDYDKILSEVWSESTGDKKTLSRLKKRILEKVQDALGEPIPELIETVVGEGLILHAEVIVD